MALIPLVFVLVCTVSVFGADPCYDLGPDPETGNFALCVQEHSCITGPVATNACPSYPNDYVCCYHSVFPGREHRGTWIATVSNIDWPKSSSSSVATQQEELRFLINQIATAGLNAVYFQVRPAGDALYISDIEPWSVYLTGQQGTPPNPLWDPLQFVIDLCEPLNIEVHAWINPYRASLSPTTNGLAPNHMAVQFPQYAYPFSTFLWMDPGSEEVQNRTFNVAIDLVTRYNLGGLHMDDYFYPYPVEGVTFPDDETYRKYLESGGSLAKDDWRRDNVNRLVRRLNTGIHEAKSWVKFSVSPFGIYRAGHPEGMPPPIAGFDQYSEIYCDPKLWMQEGIVDILQPQLYWRIDPPAQSYPILLDWWVDTPQNPHVRILAAGNYMSRIEIDDWPLDEIRRQIDISRLPENRLRGSWGNVQFSAKMFRDDVKGAVGFFKTFIYSLPAFQPAYPWLSNSTFAQIKTIHPTVDILSNKLSITVGISPIRKTNHKIIERLIHQVGIYRQNQGVWNLVNITSGTKFIENGFLKLDIKDLVEGNYALTFVNRFGEESKSTFFEI